MMRSIILTETRSVSWKMRSIFRVYIAQHFSLWFEGDKLDATDVILNKRMERKV